MTIIDIEFDDDQDMFIDGSDIAFTDEDTALVQRLKIRLQFLFEEWFLDNTVGVPYTQFILDQGANIDDVYGIFRAEIADTPGVENIIDIILTPDTSNKGLTVAFEVNDGTESGLIEVSV